MWLSRRKIPLLTSGQTEIVSTQAKKGYRGWTLIIHYEYYYWACDPTSKFLRWHLGKRGSRARKQRKGMIVVGHSSYTFDARRSELTRYCVVYWKQNHVDIGQKRRSRARKKTKGIVVVGRSPYTTVTRRRELTRHCEVYWKMYSC